MSEPSLTKLHLETVAAILENYANRGVFRGFNRGPVRGSKARFKMVWHHDRPFELVLDTRAATLRFPEVLPGVPPKSEMARDFEAFLEQHRSEELPEHRRIDPAKAEVVSVNKRGMVSLTLSVKDGDFEYSTKKLIHLMDEIFKNFLCDGPWYEYQVEHLGLDPDRY